jgi:hypothetical protein
VALRADNQTVRQEICLYAMSPTFKTWYREVRIRFGSWGRNVLILNECECSRSEDETEGLKWSSIYDGGGTRRPVRAQNQWRNRLWENEKSHLKWKTKIPLPWNYPMERACLRLHEPKLNQEGIFEVLIHRDKYSIVLGNYVRI